MINNDECWWCRCFHITFVFVSFVFQLIQFLVTMVQPTRSGLGGMGGTSSGLKRRFQLMINDAPRSSKVWLEDAITTLVHIFYFGVNETIPYHDFFVIVFPNHQFHHPVLISPLL